MTAVEIPVTAADTAAALDPSLPAVASTPWVVSRVEGVCHQLVAQDLADGEVTVGGYVALEHLLPSAVGARLRFQPELLQQEGSTYTFRVTVHDGDALVAKAEHVRKAVAGAALEHIAAKLLAASGTTA